MYVCFYVCFYLYLYVCVPKHHGQMLGLKKPKFGMCSPRTWVSVINTYGHGNNMVLPFPHPQEVILTEKSRSEINQEKIWCGLQVPGKAF